MTGRALLVGALALASLAGCGELDIGMTEGAAGELQARVAEVRDLAQVGRPDQVDTKLDELRVVVGDLQDRGELSERRSQLVLAAADAVEAHLGLITVTTVAPAPAEHDHGDDDRDDDRDDDDRDRDDEDRGKGKGKADD